MRVLFVGDGQRDAATVPRLVERILGRERGSIQEDCRHWARLHDARRGYERKLLYAVAQARTIAAMALVATVDADRQPGTRWKALLKGKMEALAKYPDCRVAVGEARPHGEAWLLDDYQAVRKALGLRADAEIMSIRKTDSPKRTLEELCSRCPRANKPFLSLLEDIACCVEPGGCLHASETGFERFVNEVRKELGR